METKNRVFTVSEILAAEKKQKEKPHVDREKLEKSKQEKKKIITEQQTIHK